MPKKTLKKVVKKKLSTGHEIELVATDVKMLRSVYEYMAGFVKRKKLVSVVEGKKAEVVRLEQLLGMTTNTDVPESPTTRGGDEKEGGEGKKEKEKENVAEGAPVVATDTADVKKGEEGEEKQRGAVAEKDDFGVDLRTERELMQDRYYQSKEEVRVLEEKVANFNKHEHRISVADMDAILKQLGSPHTARAIEYMIWEVDEHADGVVDWDEFLLTYFRNIQQTNNGLTEPNNFFNILEFISFDPAHRGFIMEDDVMEILFTRYGSARLEKELDFIFSNNLRSKGGDGTIDLAGYLAAVLGRTGRRAIMAVV